MKGQDKTPEKKKKLNEVEIGKLQKKKKNRFQNNDSEDNPGSQKNNGKDARNVYQRPRKTKEQINRDE